MRMELEIFYSFNLKNILDGHENFTLKMTILLNFRLAKTEGDDRFSLISFDFNGKKSFEWNDNFNTYDLDF